jgi:uncharacterized Zn-finger protein
MGDESQIAEVASRTVGCRGEAAAPHPTMLLVLEAGRVTTCPVCGRRFRRTAPPDLVGPAVWPREE